MAGVYLISAQQAKRSSISAPLLVLDKKNFTESQVQYENPVFETLLIQKNEWFFFFFF
jgi:hypothetical protein